MLGSDIMITDVSSIGIEYMFTGKPVIFLPAPEFFKIFGRDKPIYWVRNGLEVKDIEELKSRIETAVSRPEDFQVHDLSQLSFNQGKAVEFIVTWLKELNQR